MSNVLGPENEQPLLGRQPLPKKGCGTKVPNVAQGALKVKGTGPAVGGPSSASHMPPLPRGTGSDLAVPSQELLTLAAMASKLAKGAHLVSEKGTLKIKEKPLFFTSLSKDSTSNARLFLDSLVEQVRDATPADHEAVKKILNDFHRSKWFEKASKKDRSLLTDITWAFNEISKETRVSTETNPSPGLPSGHSPKPSSTRTPSPEPPSQAFSGVGHTTLLKAGNLLDFFSKFQEGVPISIGQQRYWVRPRQGAVEFLEYKNKKWLVVGTAFKDSKTGELRPTKEGAFPPLMINCIQKYTEKTIAMSGLYDSLYKEMVNPRSTSLEQLEAGEKAKKIVQHWADEPSWRHYVVGQGIPPFPDTPPGLEVWLQPKKGSLERISGFKAGSPGNEAWLSLELLGKGGFAGAKKMIRIPPFPSEDINVEWVRYTKADPSKKAEFKEDMENRLELQEQILAKARGLKPDLREDEKFIAKIEEFPAYATQEEGESPKAKSRCISERAPGTLLNCLYRKIADGKDQLLPQNELDRQRPLALHTFYDCVRGVRFLHACGFVHKDLKPENVFLPGRQLGADGKRSVGRVADLGFTTQAGNHPAAIAGTVGYTAPELYTLKKEATSVDLFSLGVMLTELIDPKEIGQRLRKTNTLRHDHENDPAKGIDAATQKKEIEDIQTELRSKNDPLYDLAADLISFDPASRPDASQVEKRLSQILSKRKLTPP